MKVSQLNDYIQTLATIGAIAGLLLVAYEIRQSTRIALAESYRDGTISVVDLLSSGLESGISGSIIRAEIEPEALTPAEKMNLDLWFRANVTHFHNEYEQIAALGVDVEEELRSYDKVVEMIAPRMFSSAWSRAWFYEKESTMSPKAAETIRRAFEKTPLKRNIDAFKRIDEKAVAIQ